MAGADQVEGGPPRAKKKRAGTQREIENERARLADQLIAAEQEERRRISLFLHDGPVQSLSGIALMLDAALHQLSSGKLDEATQVIEAVLERQRSTIKDLRDLSFNLEPVVLRDQGFEPAVKALADDVGIANEIHIELETGFAENLAKRAQVVFYQIIREAFHQAIRRGPPTRLAVALHELSDGRVELIVADNAPGERRRTSYETIDERARVLGAKVSVRAASGGGTVVRVVVPAYAAER
ncbi:MAG: sensor histidine kinase [Gaiellaceae bacterium]